MSSEVFRNNNSPPPTPHSNAYRLIGLLFALLLGMLPYHAHAGWIIMTIGGNGGDGFSGDGSIGSLAVLKKPVGIATDSQGNLYFTDTYNNRVRKIDTKGKISTIAGNGAENSSGDDGAATAAGLKKPLGIAVDKDGNIYVADTDNNRIRKIDTSGKITTVAGTDGEGFSGEGGFSKSAMLKKPAGVAVDDAGNIYVADTGNNRIRKIDSTGTITTIAGDGTEGDAGDDGYAKAARLKSPQGIAVDKDGNIYFADTNNNRVRKIDSTGTITTVAGNGTEGDSEDNKHAKSASIKKPTGVAVDSKGNLYIADTDNNRIRKVDAVTGDLMTLAGNGLESDVGDDDDAYFAGLKKPRGVAVDSKGNLYIADTNNNRIRKLVFAPYTIKVTSGANQIIKTGETSTSIVFTVKDALGNPATGKAINFTVKDVFGDPSTATSQATLTPTTATTDTDGKVATKLSSTNSSIYKVIAKLTDDDKGFTTSAATFIMVGSASTGGGIDMTGQTVINITITTGVVATNVTVGGTVVNNGTVASPTIQPNATLQGGVVSGTVANQGIVVDIQFTGTLLSGGTLSGTIQNTGGGTVQDVTFAANTSIKGGKLKGKIKGHKGDAKSRTVLEDVEIDDDCQLSDVVLGKGVKLPKGKNVILVNVTFTVDITVVTGVKLQGDITGDAQVPTLLDDVEVVDDSVLVNVVISAKVKLPKKVKFGKGVRFVQVAQIPKDLDLATVLPDLPVPSDCTKCTKLPKTTRIDLSIDVLQTGKGILSSLNNLSFFMTKGWKLVQHKTYGYLHVVIGTLRFAIQPITVLADSAPATTDSTQAIADPTTVKLTTPDGVTVTGQPTAQDPIALQDGLKTLGLPEVTTQPDGNMSIAATPTSQDIYSAQPSVATEEVSVTGGQDDLGNSAVAGLHFVKSAHVTGLSVAYQTFTDDDGKLRRQFFYPAPAQPKIVVSFVRQLGIEMDNSWQVKFTTNGKKYHGALNYLIIKGTPPADGKLKIDLVKVEGVKINYVLTYPNGNQQQLVTQPAE